MKYGPRDSNLGKGESSKFFDILNLHYGGITILSSVHRGKRAGQLRTILKRCLSFPLITLMKKINQSENGSGMFVEISFSFPNWLCAEKVENEKAKRAVTGRQAASFAVELPKGYGWETPMAWKQAAIKSGQAFAVKVMAVGELAKDDDEKNDEWQARLAEGALERKPVEVDAEAAWEFILSEGKVAGAELPTATPGMTASPSKAKEVIADMQAKMAEMEAKLRAAGLL